jgi:hypothetical protein
MSKVSGRLTLWLVLATVMTACGDDRALTSSPLSIPSSKERFLHQRSQRQRRNSRG